MHSNKRPKSPGNPLTSFFNWRRGPADNHAQSPTASIFGSSPSLSPTATRTPSDTRTHLLAPNSQIRQATDKSARNSIESFSALPLLAPEVMKHVDSLLAELRAVGAELAASIGREMELEDELDLCKVDLQPYSTNNEAGKRTSDYYSDSGASSVRLPAADAELKLQGLEKMRRKAEQEKAQMRIDMAQKVQEDLNERKALQMHIQALEEELHNQASAHADALDRERELEASVAEHKTSLEEEQGSRQKSEHLLHISRQEAEKCTNERDNLRDEVVPQLQDRIEGLESEVTELQNLAYENTRLQQDVHWLRNENQTLVNARRLQLEMQQQHTRYRPGSSFAEPLTPDSSPDHPPRSSSLQRGKAAKHTANASPKLGGTTEMTDAESATDTIKEVEAQRDVLHQTLRNLILRRDIEARQYARQVRLLQVERDRALSGKPRRAGYSSRVRYARQEIDELRRRADEAMTQKWQCEKGLAGLKMDLDRAKEETESLRVLLQESPGTEVVLMASPSSVYDGADDESANATSVCAEGKLSGLGIDTWCGVERRRSWTIEDDGRPQKDMPANAELQVRVLAAIERGEKGQAACAQQLSILETDLCDAESALLAAQSVSESSLGSQEERVRAVGASREQHADRLIRSQLATSPLMSASASQSKACSPMLEASASMLTPLFANKRARFELAKGQPGARDDVKTLEGRVRELEDTTRRVEWEMRGAVAKMMEEQREVVALREQTAGWM